jgi:alkylated DNA repair dioxygenase AlkB
MMASNFLQTPEKCPVEYKAGWKPLVEDHATRSYSYHLPYDELNAPLVSPEQLDQWFQALHPSKYTENDGLAWSDAHYQGELLLRKTAWIVLQENCTCEYGYSDTWQPISTSRALNQVIREITKVILTVTACPTINACNLNYYPQGGGVGFHADDEFLFDVQRQANTCILSLSLGSRPTTNSDKNWGARRFLVKPQQAGETEHDTQDKYDDTVREVILRHGDILTMEGQFQNHYFHSVWPGDSKQHMDHPLCQGERINLTWRTIVQHLDGSEDTCRGIQCPLSVNNKSP